MNVKQTFELIPIVAERLEAVSKGINRSKNWIINDSLIRELKLEGVPITEEMAWGPKSPKRKDTP